MHEWWLPLLEPDGLLLRDRALRVVDPDRVLVALRSGRLRRVQRGVYLPRAVAASPVRMARAAIISSGATHAVASHVTAARVHEIPVPDASPEHVTLPRELRRRDRKDLRFHTRALQLDDVVLFDGVPVTSAVRTLADLAVEAERLDAVWAIDDSLRRGLVARDQLLAEVQRWRGGEGCALSRQRIEEADGAAESILETAGRLALLDAEVPLPVPQFRVTDTDGSVIARLDGGYPARRLGLEFDGRSVHGVDQALYRDRWRQNRLAELGWTILRFTWWDVVLDPQRFTRAVKQSLLRVAG